MTSAPAVRIVLKTDIAVIGEGQVGLSSAYHLKRRRLAANRGLVVLDQSPLETWFDELDVLIAGILLGRDLSRAVDTSDSHSILDLNATL